MVEQLSFKQFNVGSNPTILIKSLINNLRGIETVIK